jgi:small-conductance mechanosensitive channel
VDLSLPTNGHSSTNHQPPPTSHETPAKRVNPMKLKKQQNRARELEAQIATLEAEIAKDEESLANFVSAEETVRLASQLENRRAVLNKLIEEWEQASQEA